MLAQREGVELVGLTSPRSAEFVEGLGIYGRTVTYDAIDSLERGPGHLRRRLGRRRGAPRRPLALRRRARPQHGRRAHPLGGARRRRRRASRPDADPLLRARPGRQALRGLGPGRPRDSASPTPGTRSASGSAAGSRRSTARASRPSRAPTSTCSRAASTRRPRTSSRCRRGSTPRAHRARRRAGDRRVRRTLEGEEGDEAPYDQPSPFPRRPASPRPAPRPPAITALLRRPLDATGTFVGPGPIGSSSTARCTRRRPPAGRIGRLKMTAHYPDGSTKVLDTGPLQRERRLRHGGRLHERRHGNDPSGAEAARWPGHRRSAMQARCPRLTGREARAPLRQANGSGRPRRTCRSRTRPWPRTGSRTR